MVRAMLATFSKAADVFADSRLVCPQKSLSYNAQELEARVGIGPKTTVFHPKNAGNHSLIKYIRSLLARASAYPFGVHFGVHSLECSNI